MKRFFSIIILLLVTSASFAQRQNHNCRINFIANANGKRVVLNDSSYINFFGEKYTITKLKYYISNIHFTSDAPNNFRPNVFLIDAAKKNEISVPFPKKGKITGIEFLLGVDSALNVSGAQTGPLDPLNDMFWTWNNGYVMFKMEGVSSGSTADQHRIEQHIGGYSGKLKTMRRICLPMSPVTQDFVSRIIISMNLDKYWHGSNDLKISETPVNAIPGALAVKAADNFPGMFSAAECSSSL